MIVVAVVCVSSPHLSLAFIYYVCIELAHLTMFTVYVRYYDHFTCTHTHKHYNFLRARARSSALSGSISQYKPPSPLPSPLRTGRADRIVCIRSFLSAPPFAGALQRSSAALHTNNHIQTTATPLPPLGVVGGVFIYIRTVCDPVCENMRAAHLIRAIKRAATARCRCEL